MRGIPLHLSQIVLCMGVFAMAQTSPSVQAVAGRAVPAETTVQFGRLAERAEVERLLASGRAPVPFVRDIKLEPYVAPEPVQPTVRVALRMPQPAPPPETTVERPTSTRWQAVARRGSTEPAVTATP